MHLSEGGPILPEHFGITDLTARAAPRPAEIMTLGHAEEQAIVGALAGSGWNISRAASALGISRPTLYRKIRKYGLESNAAEKYPKGDPRFSESIP